MGVSKTDDGPFIDVNEAFEQVTGYTRDEVIGRTPIELGIYVDEPRHLEIVQRLKADGKVRDEEFLFKTKSGETRTGLLSLEPTDIGGETCVLGVISDVTERKQAEEAISSVSRRLIEAQEQERARIARDLHDDINQQLALLVIQFEQLKNDLPSSAKGLPSRIDQLKTQASQIAADVQAISHELHPPKLDYLGIAAAMKSFCAEFAGQQKVEVGFSQEDVPRSVPPEISLCLFRVLQEGLHNAVKHSGARHFRVSLRGSAHEIELLVHDSGRGFDPIVPANNVGLGLISMQERLQLVKGTFLIDSQPNHGTTIRARVPLRSEEGSLQATA
jgi:PAS domain S-box-containing protein